MAGVVFATGANFAWEKEAFSHTVRLLVSCAAGALESVVLTATFLKWRDDIQPGLRNAVSRIQSWWVVGVLAALLLAVGLGSIVYLQDRHRVKVVCEPEGAQVLLGEEDRSCQSNPSFLVREGQPIGARADGFEESHRPLRKWSWNRSERTEAISWTPRRRTR